MTYWRAKSDLTFVTQFRSDANEMWALEDRYEESARARSFRDLSDPPDVKADPEYREVRGRIAEGMNRAEGIARQHQVGHSMSIVLRDWGRMPPDRQNMTDGINRTVGAVEQEVREEWRHVVNPAWWVLQGVAFVLRIPFEVAVMMGADREKLEKEVWPKVLSAVLSTVLVAALLAWLGLK